MSCVDFANCEVTEAWPTFCSNYTLTICVSYVYVCDCGDDCCVANVRGAKILVRCIEDMDIPSFAGGMNVTSCVLMIEDKFHVMCLHEKVSCHMSL